MIIRLNPPLLLETPYGYAEAHFMIERSCDHDLEWVCFIQEGKHTGECWVVRNPDIRQCENITMGRYAKKEDKKT